MSTNTTVGSVPTAASTRASRSPRSQPELDTGTSASAMPEICAVASTSARASGAVADDHAAQRLTHSLPGGSS